MNDSIDFMSLTADIVSAHVSNNSVSTGDLPGLITATYAALSGVGNAAPEAPSLEEYTPAVTVRKSLADPNKIISMIDGKPYSMLKRHLSQNGLTPAEYRKRYGLKADYPMVAPSYSENRRSLAHAIGLGRKGRGSAIPEAAPEPKRRGRPKGSTNKLTGKDALAKARGQQNGGMGGEGQAEQNEA